MPTSTRISVVRACALGNDDLKCLFLSLYLYDNPQPVSILTNATQPMTANAQQRLRPPGGAVNKRPAKGTLCSCLEQQVLLEPQACIISRHRRRRARSKPRGPHTVATTPRTKGVLAYTQNESERATRKELWSGLWSRARARATGGGVRRLSLHCAPSHRS